MNAREHALTASRLLIVDVPDQVESARTEESLPGIEVRRARVRHAVALAHAHAQVAIALVMTDGGGHRAG